MNYADLKAMLAEAGVTMEILTATELAAALQQPEPPRLDSKLNPDFPDGDWELP